MEPVTEPTVDRDALLAEAMKAVALENGAAVSVAVFDIDSGEGAAYGEGPSTRPASSRSTSSRRCCSRRRTRTGI